MLADEIQRLERMPLPLPPALVAGHRDFCRDVAKAQRFVLAPAASVAAAEVSKWRASTLLECLHLVRLPFPLTWIEYATADRPRRGLEPDDEQDRPKTRRVGFLCREHDPAGKHIEISVAWSFTDPRYPPNIGMMSGRVDLSDDGGTIERVLTELLGKAPAPRTALERDFLELVRQRVGQAPDFSGYAEDYRRLFGRSPPPGELEAAEILARHVDYSISSYFAELVAWIIAERGRAGWERMGAEVGPSWLADIKGEIGFCLAALALLNSKNAVETVEQPGREPGTGKQGRPLFSHRIVDLSLSRVQRRSLQSAGMTAAQMRLHLVRGHFKARRSGIYWWRAHPRGYPAAGAVSHDYRLTD
jgi:hypothetical protein